MSIIITKNNKDAVRVNEISFNFETNLQKYILDNPESIPLYEINENINTVIIAREFHTTVGFVDALVFDQLGNIYVIETKLFKNPDKRKVIAQSLDYGASLWKNTGGIDNFIDNLNKHTLKNFGNNFKNKIKTYYDFDEDDFLDFYSNVKSNLDEGIIKYIILMDRLDDQMKDLITYVNQNSKFDIYAVTFKYYKHEGFEIVIPDLYGSETKKDINIKSNQSVFEKSSEKEFLISLDNNVKNKLITEEIKTLILSLKEILKDLAVKSNGKYHFDLSLSTREKYIGMFLFDEYGKVNFNLKNNGKFSAYPGNEGVKEGIQITFLKELISKIVDNKLLNKTRDHLDYSMWHVNLNKSSDNEVNQLLNIIETIK